MRVVVILGPNEPQFENHFLLSMIAIDFWLKRNETKTPRIYRYVCPSRQSRVLNV